jgi:hypothetical protein
MGQWERYLAAALVASAFFGWRGSVAQADPITDANVDAAVAAAKTPEDHQALATFFTSKAEAAIASAENHDKMAKAFGPSKSMAAHCASLAAADRKQAKDYSAMAKMQEQLAKGKPAKTGGKHKM